MPAIIALIGQILNIIDSKRPDNRNDSPHEKIEQENGSLLHECQDCGVVYLSENPRECSNCGTTTVSVESRE